ncbi:hypothetical protein [Lentzea albidocapillata]|uniref:Uncharacterized protein n=1 Tax=Lentzea albidocapillata TaxID=40571 RepID=A0A1W1ZLA1_9PSEU|nr:hypothetical protein [Lentzea albidocapillata]SMC49219.1 hypothetical protein SAMN05660733_00089 [Lentzea albidocapillata]
MLDRTAVLRSVLGVALTAGALVALPTGSASSAPPGCTGTGRFTVPPGHYDVSVRLGSPWYAAVSGSPRPEDDGEPPAPLRVEFVEPSRTRGFEAPQGID